MLYYIKMITFIYSNHVKACLRPFNPVLIRFIMSGRTISRFRGYGPFSILCFIILWLEKTVWNRFLGLISFMRKLTRRRMDMSLHQSHSDMCDIVTQHVTMCQASLMVNHSNNSILYMNFHVIQVHLRLMPGVVWIITN